MDKTAKVGAPFRIHPRFDQAARIFADRFRKDPNVIGVLATGSVVHGTPDKNSDVDMHVIKKTSRMRERGNTWIKGIEIEYFINPVAQVRQYFKSDWADHEKTMTHMLANSVVLYKKGPVLGQLIREAKRFLSKPLPQMSKTRSELTRYEIDDLRKDLEDMIHAHDRVGFEQVAHHLLKVILDGFFRVHRIPQAKSKRMYQELYAADPAFAQTYKKAILETDQNRKYTALCTLANRVEKRIGGPRPKEWLNKSICPIYKRKHAK
jgi:predicted nucleotidyltransferase